MTVYAIGQITITDREAYGRYQVRFMDVFRKFRGRLLAAHERPHVVEGSWDWQKVILASFPDERAFREWFDSPEYREIARDRRAGARAVIVLAQGLG